MHRERLGGVSVPSGTLTLLDPGHIGMYEEKEIPAVPSLTVAGLPSDRVLDVLGVRVGEGPLAACWDHVVVLLRDDATVAASEDVGDAIVDFERLMLIDAETAELWSHAECLDGLADFVFSGDGASEMAAELGASALGDGLYGWRDADADEVMRHAIAAEALKDQHAYDVTTDYRPHSHYFQALEPLRASDTQSSTIEIEGDRVCLFATSFGNGLFPVYLDVAGDGTPVQLRVQLRTEASEDEMLARR